MIPSYEVIIVGSADTIKQAERWCLDRYGSPWCPLSGNQEGKWAMFYHRKAYPSRGPGSIPRDHDAYRFIFVEDKDAFVFSLTWK
jgi:hypothetical protein